MEIKNMGYAELDERMEKLPREKDLHKYSEEDLNGFKEQAEAIENRRAEIKDNIEKRKLLLEKVANATPGDGSGIRYLSSISKGKD